MKSKAFDEQNISQKPAIELLQSLGYKYLSPEEAKAERGNLYNVLLKDVLKGQLEKLNSIEYKGKKQPFSEKNIQQAISDLDEPLTDGLVKTNEKIHESILLGRSYQETMPDGTRRSFTIEYIDWEQPENNVFHVTEEFSVEREDGRGNAKPDIILFVNGIPFGAIECKRSSIDLSQGIEQTIGYQQKHMIPQLYKYMQILLATNKNETSYATCATPKRFWGAWREENEDWLNDMLYKHVKGRMPTRQDETIVSLFSPARLMELTRYFTLFDKDVKKIARYQQYFAVHEILRAVKQYDENGNRQGGVIWHTQGSGKSLTMVMVARYIFSDPAFKNPRVVLVTDRVNLDKQIRNTFAHTKLKPYRAKSGQNLVDLIQNENARVITTLVHKFDKATKKHTRMEEKDIFIMVDESHRTHYGEMHIKMKQVFPNACYLGFTGTPLMRSEKNTMIKFGRPKPIHTYTIADGVTDKAIVPLLYEGKMVDQSVNQKAIDNRLEMITRHLTGPQKNEVMQKWSRFEKIASTIQRIQFIAFDVNEHFRKYYKTPGNQFNAMLVANSKVEAIKYLQAFDDLGDLTAAVVISPPDQREGYDEIDSEPKNEVRKFWDKMMAKYGDEESYEESIKDDFINGEIDLLIVVDKLLTGFDAPRATVMYVDKPMKEHSLLQAIARVNRIYEGKDYGFIIDYRGLLDRLDEAMNMYSGSGLENYDPDDLKGAMFDVKKVIGDLRQTHSQLLDLFLPIKNKNDMEEYELRLENVELREEFYEILSRFGRNLGIALKSEEIYDALDKDELDRYKQDLKFFQELRRSVKLRYSDSIDHKEYEAQMQRLMDNHISANEVVRITNPVDILDEEGFEKELERLGSDRAKADAIRTRVNRRIQEKWDENPAYYKKFSERIKETLQAYLEKRISDAEYLIRMHQVKEDIKGSGTGMYYPDAIRNNENAQAFYGVVKEVGSRNTDINSDDDFSNLALDIEKIIHANAKVDWHDNPEVHKKIEQEVDDLLFDFTAKHNVEFTIEQVDEIIESVKTVALRRF